MAEERLIDDDKDKKYRIRKNADGEDELYIDDSGEEKIEEVTFVVEEDAQDMQSDYDYRYAQTEDEDAQKIEKVNKYIQCARKDCEEGRFATAADYLEKAIELDEENGEVYALELIIYTRNFTDYSSVKEAAGYSSELKKYTSAETKQGLFAKAETALEENINRLQKTVETLSQENQSQKAVRAKKFVADRNRFAIVFSIALAMFFALGGLSFYCYLNVHTVKTNAYLVATIVLMVVAIIVLIISGIVLSKLITACRRVRLNNKDTSTELGRKMLANRADLEAFTAIYEALKG